MDKHGVEWEYGGTGTGHSDTLPSGIMSYANKDMTTN